MSDIALQLQGVGKQFREGFWMRPKTALEEVSFSVPKGSLFGYLGHNGAGKTTTIKMLLGLTRPSRGSVTVWGNNPSDPATRTRVGYLPEQPYFYDYLSAGELLRLHGELCGMTRKAWQQRSAEVLEMVGMHGVEHITLGKFSKGMLQRIGLAQALMGDPDLLIFDEPMSGLDPAGRKRVRDLMVSLKARGKTVFFSTHVLADAEAICDQVAILVKGRMRSVGSLAELLTPKVTEVALVVAGLPAGRVVAGHPVVNGEAHLLLTEADSGAAIRQVLDAGGRVVSVTPHRETLESLFMSELDAVERAG